MSAVPPRQDNFVKRGGKMKVQKFLIVYLLFTAYCLLSIGVSGCKKNNAPEKPKTPWGLVDNKGYVDTVYIFITDARDPEDEDVAFKFNWGDGNESNWSADYIGSGETFNISHSYSVADTYYVKAKAKDIHNSKSDWSAPYKIVITSKSAPPFNATIIQLSDTIGLGKPMDFKVCAIDTSLGDSVKYQCMWGNKIDASWTNQFSGSGDTIVIHHTYLDTLDLGLQYARVRAKDKYGSTSEWSLPCTVIVQFPPPPNPPNAPTLKKQYTVYYLHTIFTFTASGLDTSLYHQFVWEDGSPSPGWLSGGTVELPHSFAKTGVCSVRLRARNKKYEQLVSDCSSPYEIEITSNFIKEWGGLDAPFGITVSGDSVYVVDHNAHEVKIFSEQGSFLDAIGTDDLLYPMYLATDDDFVYVTDEANFVYKFNKNGLLDTKWGGQGAGEGKFDLPTGITVDANYVYVVDTQNDAQKARIQKFNKDGSFVTQWKIFDQARGMTISGDTLFVACNFAHKIRVFNTDGTSFSSIGDGEGTIDACFRAPCDIAVFGDSVYVVDTDNNRVQKFRRDNGSFVIRWGCGGSEPGQFNEPQGIAINSTGDIYVVDTGNNRIQNLLL